MQSRRALNLLPGPEGDRMVASSLLFYDHGWNPLRTAYRNINSNILKGKIKLKKKWKVLWHLLLFPGWNTTSGICSWSCRTGSRHCSDQKWNGKLGSGYDFPWLRLFLSWIDARCLFLSLINLNSYLIQMSPFPEGYRSACILLGRHFFFSVQNV